MKSRIAVICFASTLPACVGDRVFWDYLVDDSTHHQLPEHQLAVAEAVSPRSSDNIKVVAQNGSVMTEQIIPILTSAQTVIIEPASADRPPAAVTLEPL